MVIYEGDQAFPGKIVLPLLKPVLQHLRRFTLLKHATELSHQREVQHTVVTYVVIVREYPLSGILVRLGRDPCLSVDQEVGLVVFRRPSVHPIRIFQKQRPESVFHINGGVDAKPVDALVDPEPVAIFQSLDHDRIFRVQIIEIRKRGIETVGVLYLRRPVVDVQRALRRVVVVVLIKRVLCGLFRRNALLVYRTHKSDGVVYEVIPDMVDHDVLYHADVLFVGRLYEVPVQLEVPEVFVDRLEVTRPVSVIPSVLNASIPPLIGHRRRDPDSRGSQLFDIV